MRTTLFAAVVALFTLACGDLEVPESLPGCDGDAWCEIEEACYTQQAGVSILDRSLSVVAGFQGGFHVDVPLEVTGLDLDAQVDVVLISNGRFMRSYEGGVFWFDYDGCRGSARWVIDDQATDVLRSRGDGPYELVVRARTWAGVVEQRATVTIDNIFF